LSNFQFTAISSYHSQLVNGHTSCVVAVNFYLSQIDKHKALNAFVEVFAEEALSKATALDEKRKAGHPLKKLHGVVIAIKDVICYKGHRITAASAMLEGFTSLIDATAIQLLLEEDAILIGNCNCDEFAMGSSNENSVYGNVLNAHDHSKVPGGSSGGSAVAVQADMCMIALGSDTGGSVRQPADFCGIIGLKPGYGSVSRHGLIAYASSFDQIGIFGKQIEDVALTLEIISKPDEYDSTMEQDYFLKDVAAESNHKAEGSYCVGIFDEVMQHPSLDPEIRNAILEKTNQLEKSNHKLVSFQFEWLDKIVPAYYVLTAAEASSNLSRYDGIRYGHQSKEPLTDLNDFYIKNRTEGFGKEVKRRIMLGNFVLSSGYYDAYYSKAQQVRKLLVQRMEELFKQCDFIIMPCSPTTAFNIGAKQKDPIEMYLADIFTVFANLTGVPAIALPLFQHSNGMPFGLQVIGKRKDEARLLSFSKMLMRK
jgi:aspartyl-tRNA(Asn)/glutamyl-tRNA(Gln) amidotransferase subunit A